MKISHIVTHWNVRVGCCSLDSSMFGVLGSSTVANYSCRHSLVSLRPQVLEHSKMGKLSILLESSKWQSGDGQEAERQDHDMVSQVQKSGLGYEV